VSVATATAADILQGCDPQDRSGNTQRLTDAGWERAAAQVEAGAFANLGAPRPAPLALDFDVIPEPPDWVIHRLVERGTVVVLSGDTGSAKSIVSSSIIPAALEGRDWLGHATTADRIMVVDEENPDRLASARLRALGTTNAMRDRLRYFSRQGVALGDGGTWDAWAKGELEDFGPDLLVIDTLMAACAVEDTNSNSEAVRMMKFLRSLARDFKCGVLLLHHERKRSLMNPSSSGQAMLGARQWAGQADAQMTLTVESDLIEDEAETEGHRSLRRTFKFRPAEKDRDGRPNVPRRVAVESEKDERGRLLWMRVEDKGPITEEGAQDHDASAILANLATAQREGDGVVARKELAAAAGEKNPESPSGTFKTALSNLLENGKVEKVGRRYKATEAGMASAGLEI
jgi:hypothetical protein